MFANEDESLVVISIKGTSGGLWTGGPTGEKDKLNVTFYILLRYIDCIYLTVIWLYRIICYFRAVVLELVERGHQYAIAIKEMSIGVKQVAYKKKPVKLNYIMTMPL